MTKFSLLLLLFILLYPFASAYEVIGGARERRRRLQMSSAHGSDRDGASGQAKAQSTPITPRSRQQPSPHPTSSPFPTTSPSIKPSTSPPSVVRAESEEEEEQKIPADTQTRQAITYKPGAFSGGRRSTDRKIRLSNGLSAKPIAQAGQFVSYHQGGRSQIRFHIDPDGAAVFPKANGGWYYVSNAEDPSRGTRWNNGGVGAIEFNQNGKVVGYERILSRTRQNCGGGRTPWQSWITCEEINGGKVYQTDPTGVRSSVRTAMGSLGMYESFAYDLSTAVPTFYVTRDADNGVLTRFTPNDEGMECYEKENNYQRWCTLEHGKRDYLVISGGSSGTFYWTTNQRAARANAAQYYPNAEGIDVADGMLYFVSKAEKRLIILDLGNMEYTWHSTRSGAFNQQPDQVARVLPDDDDDESILYFCEDGGREPGVYGRDRQGRFFTVLYGSFDSSEETTGLSFSPEGYHMYVSFQNSGVIYDVTREDGLPFHGAMLDIKYH